MTNQTQTKYGCIKNATKKYASIALMASALAFPSYAGTEDYTPKSIAIKNVAHHVDYIRTTDNHANLAMVVQKNGTNYLAEARIEVIRGLNAVVDGAEKKSAAIEALVNAELAKGTNGIVTINGNRDEKQKTIEMYAIQIDGHQINLGKTTQ